MNFVFGIKTYKCKNAAMLEKLFDVMCAMSPCTLDVLVYLSVKELSRLDLFLLLTEPLTTIRKRQCNCYQ